MTPERDPSFQQRNLFQQGYQNHTPSELKEIEWGLRFTPAACSLITLYALFTQNPWLLFAVAILGMWAFFAPAGHPMDLIYNNLVRKPFGAVKLPPNPFQRRLACFAAGIMNTIAAIFFLVGWPVAALVTGAMLIVLQIIVIFTHFCTLSWMYEGLMRVLGKWAKPIDDLKANELIDSGAMLVDVRSPEEFSRDHASNTQNMPLDDLENYVAQLKDKTVLVFCASGARSQIAKQKLSELGIEDVFDLGKLKRLKEMRS